MGLSYDQILEKNSTNFNGILKIDHITKNGNIKHDLNETNTFKRLIGSSKSVVFLIHGFMESSDGLMVQGIAPSLAKKKYMKVFALDGRNVFSLEYFRSSTYVRFIGEGLGTFLSEIINSELLFYLFIDIDVVGTA